MASIQFLKDVIDFCDTNSCSDTYDLPILIKDIVLDNYYSIASEIVSIKYFNHVTGLIEIPTKSFYSSNTSLSSNMTVKAIGVKTAVVRFILKQSDGTELASETVMIRCPLCQSQDKNQNFTIKLDTSNLSLVKNQIQIQCSDATAISAIGEKLIPGRKYSYSFRTFPSEGITLSNPSGELFAGNEESQNFNTLLFIGSYNQNKTSKFLLFFELTDMTTQTKKRTKVYSFSCSDSCGDLPENIDLDLDADNLKLNRIYTVNVKDSNTQKNINIEKIYFSIENIRHNNTIIHNNLVSLEKINSQTLGIFVPNNLRIDVDNNLSFYLKANVPHYMQTGSNLIAINTENNFISLDLLALDDMPDSISSDSTTVQTDVYGAITSDVVLSCPASLLKSETSTVTIPSGTIFMSKEGYILRDNITINTIYFGTSENNSLSVMSGGVNLPGYLDENNLYISEKGVFYSYGYLKIEAKDSNGNFGHTISQPAIVIAEIPTSSQSTDINDPGTIKDGDIIPIWVLDNQNGLWKHNGNATYNLGQISFTTNFLSSIRFASVSNDICSYADVPISSFLLKEYFPLINSNGLYFKRVNNIIGDCHNLSVMKTKPGNNFVQIIMLPKRYNNKVITSRFNLYLNSTDADSETNSIGSIVYTNSTIGSTICNCSNGLCDEPISLS